MRPLPDASSHAVLSLKQKGQIARGYQCALPHAVQRRIRNRPCEAASQNACVSTVAAGAGILRCFVAMVSLPFEDKRCAAMPAAERATRAVRQREIAILHLDRRMRLAAQLAEGLDDLGHAAAIGRMVIAQSAAIGIERQSADARNQVPVGNEPAALASRAKPQIL